MQARAGSGAEPLARRLTRALRRAREYAMAVEAMPLANGADGVTLAGRYDRERIELGTRVQDALLRQRWAGSPSAPHEGSGEPFGIDDPVRIVCRSCP